MTYANSVNPDQTPHVSGLSFHAGTTFLDNFRTKFLSEKISHASFLPDMSIKQPTLHFDVTFELT